MKPDSLLSQILFFRQCYKSGLVSRKDALEAIQEALDDYKKNEEEYESWLDNGPLPRGGEL